MEKMGFFVMIFTTVIVIFFFKIYQYIKFCLVINKLPGPVIFPLPTLIFELSKIKAEDRFQWFCDTFNKFKDGLMMAPFSIDQVAVYIRKPHQLEVILSSTKLITKSHIYETLDPWLGKALLTSTGEKWFHQRKIITPSFHFGVVDTFFEIMSEKAEILNQVIEEAIKKNPENPIDFFDFANRCALDIICETAMGVNVDVQRNLQNEYMAALPKVAEIALKRMYRPWLGPDWIFYRTKYGAEFKSALDAMTKFTMQIIKKRKEARKALKNIPTSDENVDETGRRKKKALLDLLLDVNETEEIPMTDWELKEEVETFIFAGHDTTGAAVSWTIFNLANNSEVQEKVHQELDEIFGDSSKPATMKQIIELKYLDRVIKENLRLNPSVPGVGRTLTKDIDLDGHLLPTGCNLIIDIFNLHRDPEVWNDPLKFDPNRFLPENCRGRHPYAYVPFSAGSRNCIGQKFAIAELKIVLTALLRKWRVKSARTQADMKMHSTFVLRPHDGNPNYFTLKSEQNS